MSILNKLIDRERSKKNEQYIEIKSITTSKPVQPAKQVVNVATKKKYVCECGFKFEANTLANPKIICPWCSKVQKE